LTDALLLADAIRGRDPLRLEVEQLPREPDARWVALPFDPTAGPADGQLSIVAYTPSGPATSGAPFAALWLDEFNEVLPSATHTTAAAFHYDQPNATAPQAIVLAVPPRVGDNWTLEMLEATVNQTFDLARLRLVDVDALAGSGHFLPALYFALNLKGATVATDFHDATGVPLPDDRPSFRPPPPA
jgi:hypothetical protein